MESPRTKAEESRLNDVGNREPQQILSNDGILSGVFRRSAGRLEDREITSMVKPKEEKQR